MKEEQAHFPKIVNVGKYKTGSTTLAKAAKQLGYKVYRKAPDLTTLQRKSMLLSPERAVGEWWFEREGRRELEKLINENDYIGDGWISLLPFLPAEELGSFITEMQSHENPVLFVATQRDTRALVLSELHHWIREDIEAKAGLTFEERSNLEQSLTQRATRHAKNLQALFVTILPLDKVGHWYHLLNDRLGNQNGHDSGSYKPWKSAIASIGRANSAPELPLEGILLTLRLSPDFDKKMTDVECLLTAIEQDSLCYYMIVLALDSDEHETEEARKFICAIKVHCPVYVIAYPERKATEPFRICEIWDKMAKVAFENGADWVALLGDDITIDCSFHYRAFYRAFLDVAQRLRCPFGFGCPWWNDVNFCNFPTFPVVGKAHYLIFGSLIPSHRSSNFVNQDLDPYLQRLYLKFGAAPRVEDAKLENRTGGNNTRPTRYERVSADGWRDWVLEDIQPIREYLENESKHSTAELAEIECTLVDIVVPTYRVDVEYVLRICSLQVPDNLRTSILIIVDNPQKLKSLFGEHDHNQAALALESKLSENLSNNIRVRCNASNLVASATRNRGIDESSADWILFLDDDVTPQHDLLLKYGTAIGLSDESVVGMMGLVHFPRRNNLPLKHAAVLMSYLTFMFEIASKANYESPAWGVTANLLMKRGMTRFDTNYAKTGGGEDVDFCLRTHYETGGRFRSVSDAIVHHNYWPGGVTGLLSHFFNWAVGDSALYIRFREHTYRSYPNAIEFFLCFLIAFTSALTTTSLLHNRESRVTNYFLCFSLEMLLLIGVDVVVEVSDSIEFDHRKRLLSPHRFHWTYYYAAHILANIYVIVLETGRLYGHIKRGTVYVNVCRRFDWHCGRLPDAKSKFVSRELTKFCWFVVVSVVTLHISFCKW
jgi:glycosyltransferase involved in cell wall biosynthesis